MGGKTVTESDLLTRPILSLFPGIDLLGMAFEIEGFSFVVSGPERNLGRDVRHCVPAAGAMWGVMGGPPCQDFSDKNFRRRSLAAGYGVEMLAQFVRIVEQAQPAWWLLENVRMVPDVAVAGYSWQRISVNQNRYSGVNRLRHIQFGARDGAVLEIEPGVAPRGKCEGAALAGDDRPLRDVCRLQGLPPDFRLSWFREAGLKQAIGNGVPICLGRVLARGIKRAYGLDVDRLVVDRDAFELGRCRCGCGRPVSGRQEYASTSCRSREFRRRRNGVSKPLCRCGCGVAVTGRAKYHSPACRQRASRAKRAGKI